MVWLTTEANDQSTLHCVIVSTDVMSDHIGSRDASHGDGRSKTSAYSGQFRLKSQKDTLAIWFENDYLRPQTWDFWVDMSDTLGLNFH